MEKKEDERKVYSWFASILQNHKYLDSRTGIWILSNVNSYIPVFQHLIDIKSV